MTVCVHCGYFIDYERPKAPAEPGWAHSQYTPTKPDGPPCDHPEPSPASGISYTASIREKLRYDMDEGRLITESYPDGAVRQAIEIRKGLEDAHVLQAVVIELERRGYTVISPESAAEEWRP